MIKEYLNIYPFNLISNFPWKWNDCALLMFLLKTPYQYEVVLSYF